MKNTWKDWDYLFVETMFVLDPQNPQQLSNRVLFFDHYAREYRGQKSDLENYFAKLTAEGWELAGGPESFHNPPRKEYEAAKQTPPILQHLTWLYHAPGRKFYRFKRPVKR